MLAQYNRDSIVLETLETAQSYRCIRSGGITSDAGQANLIWKAAKRSALRRIMGSQESSLRWQAL
jgi:hypothetical protein